MGVGSGDVDSMARHDNDRLPQEGVILGAGISGPVSAAPVRKFQLQWSDTLVAATHPGYGYKAVNEDRIALIEVPGSFGPTTALFVIDGMGGREGGDVAAQILAEEMILATGSGTAEVLEESARFVSERIESAFLSLADRKLAMKTIKRWKAASMGQPFHQTKVEDLIHQAMEALNAESLQLETLRPGTLRQIAETISKLKQLKAPDPFEIAARRTRNRIAAARPGPAPPDACFVGGIIRVDSEGRRMLDVRQVGDCKLFVASSTGEIRFQTIGESVISEPALESPSLSLTDLMAYSLHRNLVRNSINAAELSLKRYRKQDIPVLLEEGDFVCLYSDGIDDIFTPGELLEMVRNSQLEAAIRDLLHFSENRMKYVSGQLLAQRKSLPDGQQRKAYPLVHERLNRKRLEDGYYIEHYPGAATGRWMKPPKCDNLAICVLRVGSSETSVEGSQQ